MSAAESAGVALRMLPLNAPIEGLIVVNRPLYVVEADRERSYGTLYTVTADHLLTEEPGEGDRIAVVYQGRAAYRADGGGLVRWEVEDSGEWELVTHAGRSASLGEDTLGDFRAEDALDALVPERIARAGWRYAPVTLTRRAGPLPSQRRTFAPESAEVSS